MRRIIRTSAITAETKPALKNSRGANAPEESKYGRWILQECCSRKFSYQRTKDEIKSALIFNIIYDVTINATIMLSRVRHFRYSLYDITKL